MPTSCDGVVNEFRLFEEFSSFLGTQKCIIYRRTIMFEQYFVSETEQKNCIQ